MGRGEFVDTAIWDDLDGLSLEATALYLWSFTNPRCNMAGLYVVSERAMLESKVPARKLAATLDELQRDEKLFYVRPVLWVKARVKRFYSTHANFARSIAKDVGKIDAEHVLRRAFLARYSETPWLRDALAGLALESQKEEGLPRVSETLPRVSVVVADAVVGKERGSGGKETQKPQDDRLPEELAPSLAATAATVRATLERIAEAKGAIPPTLGAVGRAMANYPDRNHLEAAGDLEHWLVHGTGQNQPVKDVVGYYRNQLKRAPQVVPVRNGTRRDPEEMERRIREADL